MGIHRNVRIEMPRILVKAWAEQPRIVLEPAPGLWPIDISVLPMLEQLLHDDAFNEQFEIMVVPK